MDAFAYLSPGSFDLNTQSGLGCNRFGWYLTPSLAELQNIIEGPLLIDEVDGLFSVVGSWVATANGVGGVSVSQIFEEGQYLATEVHIDLDCLPIDNCNPSSYTYNAGPFPGVAEWGNPTPLIYPTCPGGSQAYLIINAKVVAAV